MIEAAKPADGTADGYGLRGGALVMTLAEFRALPHPDGAASRLLCSGDVSQPGNGYLYSVGLEFAVGTDIPDDMRPLKPVGCAYFGGDAKKGEVSVVETNVGGVSAKVRYTFLEPEGTPRLARVGAVAAAYDFAILREALPAKYGPGREERHSVRAAIGVREESVVAWANPGRHQTIRRQRHGGITPRATLTLSDDLTHTPDPGKL